MDWSEDRVERLKALHAEGYSMSRIAAALGGVTRNAVLGKIHRMGLVKPAGGHGGGHTMRAPNVAKVALSAVKAKKAQLRVAARADEPAPLLGADSLPITLANCTSRHQCRWMPGDHISDLQICAHPTMPNEPWCPHHAGRVKNSIASKLAHEAATNKVPTLKERALSRAK